MKTNLNRLNKYLFLCFILMMIVSLESFAQPSFRIEGKLRSFTENKPVEFASIALHHLPDSTLVTGAVSDTTGKFSIANLKAGNYFIKVSCIGYKTIIKNGISLSSSSPQFNMGEIQLDAESQTLKEVTVEGERLKGVAEVDKTTYTINNKIAATSHSGLELLRQVPAVQVDFQHNITLEGSSNIMILVDGKQRDKDYLAQIDPNSIDKIEVMTNPSVKYDADVTGVINVILKREKKHGISGEISPEIPLSKRIFFSSSNANLEYGYNKIRVFVSGYSHFERLELNSTTNRESKEGNNFINYNQKGEGDVDVNFVGVDYGVDYFINNKNTLNLYGNYRPDNGLTFKTDGYKEYLVNNQLKSYIDAYSYDKDANTSNYYSAFYKRTFDKQGQELTFDANYYLYHGDRDANYKDQYYQADRVTPVGSLVDRKEVYDDSKQALGFKLDYIQPIKKDYKLSVGYHNYTQWMDNDFSGGEDDDITNLKYSEARHAAYASFAGPVKKLSVQTGLRYEMSLIDINDTTKTDYTCLLPQLTLQYKIGKANSLKLTYRRSIQRPGIDNLNPFVNRVDSITVSRGNPSLNPSYTNKVELNFSAPVKNSYLSSGLYYNYFTDNFQRITRINDGISESFVENIGTGSEYGWNFSGSIKINKWWQINPYFCLYRVVLDENNEYDIKSNDKVSYRANATSIFSLPKKFTVFVFTQYNSPYIGTENLNKRDALYVVGVEKELNKNFKFSLTAINPFMKNFVISETVTESENFWQDTKMDVYVQNLVTVRVTYTFKYGSKINKLERSKEVETDGNRSIF
ncbi:MAG TPA: TonB-dependent receptor [Bacteroidales bacterium]|nr:TonB-dependent receptor [Bacteroidales bacterium]